MTKKISILLLLLVTFAGLQAREQKGKMPATVTGAKECKVNLALLHGGSELHLQYVQTAPATRVVRVQKDVFSGPGKICRLSSTGLFFANVLSSTSYPFFKNYISHIYPSHHFW